MVSGGRREKEEMRENRDRTSEKDREGDDREDERWEGWWESDGGGTEKRGNGEGLRRKSGNEAVEP